MRQKEARVATLAGGCFWCLEAVYEQLRGVEKVESGYSGELVIERVPGPVAVDG